MAHALTVVTLALAAVVYSGTQAPQPTFRASSDVVAVYATVRDSTGTLVRGLTRDDFEVRENGRVTEIATFSGDLQPITLAMVLDRSGSLAARIGDVSAAARGFFGALTPGDRVSLQSLSWDCSPLTEDYSGLSSLVGVMPPDLGSPVWEAIDRAFFSMADEPGRRAILIFSDGADSGSPPIGFPGVYQGPCRMSREATGASFREVASRAARNGVLVYAVGVPTGAGGRSDRDLRTLARDTGGDLFRMQDDEPLTPVFERIAEELHHQYLLGFVPVSRDGKVASIDVRVKRRGLQVRARRRFSVAPPPAGNQNATEVPVSDADVEEAIAAGLAGRTLRAGCQTSVNTSGAYFDVSLEGPLARVMRAAREARRAGDPFDVSSVTAAMRAPTVRVTATARTAPSPGPLPGDTSTADLPREQAGPVVLPMASGLRLRSPDAVRPRLIDPVVGQVNRLQPSQTFESVFDLAAVRALGDSVEVIVLGPPNGGARCRLSAGVLRDVK